MIGGKSEERIFWGVWGGWQGVRRNEITQRSRKHAQVPAVRKGFLKVFLTGLMTKKDQSKVLSFLGSQQYIRL